MYSTLVPASRQAPSSLGSTHTPAGPLQSYLALPNPRAALPAATVSNTLAAFVALSPTGPPPEVSPAHREAALSQLLADLAPVAVLHPKKHPESYLAQQTSPRVGTGNGVHRPARGGAGGRAAGGKAKHGLGLDGNGVASDERRPSTTTMQGGTGAYDEDIIDGTRSYSSMDSVLGAPFSESTSSHSHSTVHAPVVKPAYVAWGPEVTLQLLQAIRLLGRDATGSLPLSLPASLLTLLFHSNVLSILDSPLPLASPSGSTHSSPRAETPGTSPRGSAAALSTSPSLPSSTLPIASSFTRRAGSTSSGYVSSPPQPTYSPRSPSGSGSSSANPHLPPSGPVSSSTPQGLPHPPPPPQHAASWALGPLQDTPPPKFSTAPFPPLSPAVLARADNALRACANALLLHPTARDDPIFSSHGWATCLLPSSPTSGNGTSTTGAPTLLSFAVRPRDSPLAGLCDLMAMDKAEMLPFLAARILFLVTASGTSGATAVVDLVDDCDFVDRVERVLLDYREAVLDSISPSREDGAGLGNDGSDTRRRPSGSLSTGRTVAAERTQITSEVLKLLFNVGLWYPKLKEKGIGSAGVIGGGANGAKANGESRRAKAQQKVKKWTATAKAATSSSTKKDGKEKEGGKEGGPVVGDMDEVSGEKFESLLPPLIDLFNTLPLTLSQPLPQVLGALVLFPIPSQPTPLYMQQTWLRPLPHVGVSVPPSAVQRTNADPRSVRYLSPSEAQSISSLPPFLARLLYLIDDVASLSEAVSIAHEGASVVPLLADPSASEAATGGVDLDEALGPVLTLMERLVRSDGRSAKELAAVVLDPKRDRTLPPEKQPSLLGRLVRLMNADGLGTANRLAGQVVFGLCGNDAAKLSTEIGFGNAAGFLATLNMFAPPPSSSSTGEDGSSTEGRQINPITGAYDDPNAHSDEPEMTEEEKEAEAERLFVLLDRLKRTGVMDVKGGDPRRQAVESGRFQELDGQEEEEKRREEEEEEREAEEEMRRYKERLKRRKEQREREEREAKEREA